MSAETPAQRLIYARTLAGFSTASEAARANKWNENTYRSHENGERGLRWAVITKYANAFSVPASYILTGDMGVSRTLMTPIAGLLSGSGVKWFYEDVISGERKARIAGLFVQIRKETFAVAIDRDVPPIGFLPDSLLICFREQYSIEDSIESLCVIRYDTDKYIATVPSETNEHDRIRVVTTPMSSIVLKPEAIWGVCLVVPPRQWKALDHQPAAA